MLIDLRRVDLWKQTATNQLAASIQLQYNFTTMAEWSTTVRKTSSLSPTLPPTPYSSCSLHVAARPASRGPGKMTGDSAARQFGGDSSSARQRRWQQQQLSVSSHPARSDADFHSLFQTLEFRRLLADLIFVLKVLKGLVSVGKTFLSLPIFLLCVAIV